MSPASRPPCWSGSPSARAPSCCHQSHLGMHGAPLTAQTGVRIGPCVPKAQAWVPPCPAPAGDEPLVGPFREKKPYALKPQALPWVLLSCGSTWDRPFSVPGGTPRSSVTSAEAGAGARRSRPSLQGDSLPLPWPIPHPEAGRSFKVTGPGLLLCIHAVSPGPGSSGCCGLLCRREVTHASTRLGTWTCSKYLSPAKGQAKVAQRQGSPFHARCGHGPQTSAQHAGEHGSPVHGRARGAGPIAPVLPQAWGLGAGCSLPASASPRQTREMGGVGSEGLRETAGPGHGAADLGPRAAASGCLHQPLLWTVLTASSLGEPRHPPLPLAVPQPGALRRTSSRSPAGRSLDTAQDRVC